MSRHGWPTFGGLAAAMSASLGAVLVVLCVASFFVGAQWNFGEKSDGLWRTDVWTYVSGGVASYHWQAGEEFDGGPARGPLQTSSVDRVETVEALRSTERWLGGFDFVARRYVSRWPEYAGRRGGVFHLRVPLVWPALALTLPLAARAGWRRLRRRPMPGRCRACGYDLRATPLRCPECGATA